MEGLQSKVLVVEMTDTVRVSYSHGRDEMRPKDVSVLSNRSLDSQ